MRPEPNVAKFKEEIRIFAKNLDHSMFEAVALGVGVGRVIAPKVPPVQSNSAGDSKPTVAVRTLSWEPSIPTSLPGEVIIPSKAFPKVKSERTRFVVRALAPVLDIIMVFGMFGGVLTAIHTWKIWHEQHFTDLRLVMGVVDSLWHISKTLLLFSYLFALASYFVLFLLISGTTLGTLSMQSLLGGPKKLRRL